jgi:photosystem II stability/assembly factor-like uncharacterized protein
MRITILVWLLLLTSALPGNASQNPSENLNLQKVYFADELQGWILGSAKSEGLIVQSTDGGQTWQERYRCTEGLFNIKFANRKVGWVVGSNGTILHTTDGGASWKRQVSGTKVLLTGLAVVDVNEAWVAGASGTLLTTNDGGITWNKRKVDTPVGISDITFVDPKHGRAVGYGTILSTNDGGQTWELKSSGDWKPLSSVVFANENLGWITVGPVVLRTTDGGKTWGEILPPSQGQATSLSFVDAQHGWVAKARGEEGSVVHIPGHDKLSSESFILSTVDGGVTWQNIFHIGNETDHSAWVLNIFFVNLTKGWAVGRDGLIMRTADSGKSWQKTQLALTTSAATACSVRIERRRQRPN